METPQPEGLTFEPLTKQRDFCMQGSLWTSVRVPAMEPVRSVCRESCSSDSGIVVAYKAECIYDAAKDGVLSAGTALVRQVASLRPEAIQFLTHLHSSATV